MADAYDIYEGELAEVENDCQENNTNNSDNMHCGDLLSVDFKNNTITIRLTEEEIGGGVWNIGEVAVDLSRVREEG